jgi:small GTP-binding protein
MKKNKHEKIEEEFEIEEEDEKENIFKVILLGKTSVGKTSLLKRFINGTFDQNIISTTGFGFECKKIYYKNLKKYVTLNIWDTAGQERYSSLIELYYKNTDCILFIYDLTDKTSLINLNNYYESIQNNLDVNKVLLCIVGTKKDLYDQIDDDDNNNNDNDNNYNDNNNKVNLKEIKEFADKINAKICKQTSALLNYGIEDLFKEIGYKLYSTLKDSKKENSLNISIYEPVEDKKKSFCC